MERDSTFANRRGIFPLILTMQLWSKNEKLIKLKNHLSPPISSICNISLYSCVNEAWKLVSNSSSRRYPMIFGKLEKLLLSDCEKGLLGVGQEGRYCACLPGDVKRLQPGRQLVITGHRFAFISDDRSKVFYPFSVIAARLIILPSGIVGQKPCASKNYRRKICFELPGYHYRYFTGAASNECGGWRRRHFQGLSKTAVAIWKTNSPENICRQLGIFNHILVPRMGIAVNQGCLCHSMNRQTKDVVFDHRLQWQIRKNVSFLSRTVFFVPQNNSYLRSGRSFWGVSPPFSAAGLV